MIQYRLLEQSNSRESHNYNHVVGLTLVVQIRCPDCPNPRVLGCCVPLVVGIYYGVSYMYLDMMAVKTRL